MYWISNNNGVIQFLNKQSYFFCIYGLSRYFLFMIISTLEITLILQKSCYSILPRSLHFTWPANLNQLLANCLSKFDRCSYYTYWSYYMYCSDFWWIVLFIFITAILFLLYISTYCLKKKWIVLLIFITVLLFLLYILF